MPSIMELGTLGSQHWVLGVWRKLKSIETIIGIYGVHMFLFDYAPIEKNNMIMLPFEHIQWIGA